MPYRTTLLLAVALMLGLILAAPASAQTAPPNDLFANAVPITTIGKTIRTDHIHLTTAAEVGEPGTCVGSNSVWFKFAFPFAGNLSVSTGGSYMAASDGSLSTETAIGIFTGAGLGSLAQSACNDDFGGTNYGEITAFSFAANTTYYVRVSAVTSVNVGSYYLLTTRLQGFDNWDMNGENLDFESPLGGEWKVKNASGADAQQCGTTGHSGTCLFKFTNSAGENSSIKQNIPWPAFIKPRANDTIGLSGYVYSDGVVSAANVSVSLTLYFTNGTSSVVKKTVTVVAPGWTPVYLYTNISNTKVLKLRIMVKNKSTTGSTLIDNFGLHYRAGAVREAPLALPAAAQ